MPRASKHSAVVPNDLYDPAHAAPTSPSAPGVSPTLSNDSKKKRTTSGCLTCRIRRKKCESEPGPTGDCKTCVRLNLECLGWSAKRPAWMKDKALLDKRRAEIKQHLTAQGLVRGVTKHGDDDESEHTTKSRRRNPPPPKVANISPPPEEIPSLYEEPPFQDSSFQGPPSPKSKRRAHITVETAAIPLSTLYTPLSPTRFNAAYQTSRHHTRSPVLPPLSEPSSSNSESSSNDSPTLLRHLEYAVGMPSAHVGGADPYESTHKDLSNPIGPQSYSDSLALAFPSPSTVTTYNGYDDLYPYGPMALPVFNDVPEEMNARYDSLIVLGCTPDQAFEMLTGVRPLQGPNSPVPQYEPRIRNMPPPGSSSANQEDLLFNYFSRVSSFQYLFDDTSSSTMQTLVIKSPNGPVANAIMAISALHDIRMRHAEGLEGGHLRNINSHEILYGKVKEQLQQAISAGARLTEAEGIAALHIVSWWLFEGGHGDWAGALRIAGDWYEQESRFFGADTPLESFLKMSPEKQFAAKTTMWMDIFSSITLLTPPRFGSFYRMYLSKGYSEQSQIFSSANGCCDVVMLTLASIVELECAKDQCNKRQMHDFQRRLINADLTCRAHALREDLLSVETTPQPRIVEVSASSTSVKPEVTITSNIFRYAALVYLSTIVNGYSPDVPDTFDSVQGTALALSELPPSPIDRSLVFPICIAGCMTDQPDQRAFFQGRLDALTSPVGNTSLALMLMREVWKRRDETGVAVGWRDVMIDMDLALLLV